MRMLWYDLKTSLRMLRTSPVFALVAILSLALGIGANTTVFTLVDAILMPRIGAPEPERLVAVYGTEVDAGRDGVFNGYLPISQPNYRDFRDQNGTLSGLATWHGSYMGLAGTDDGEPRQILGEFVSHNYFDTFEVKPAIGSFFQPKHDEKPGAHPVTVLSHRLWRQRYGSDPEILGETVNVNGRDLTVIGVAPRGFDGTQSNQSVALWVPNGMFTLMTRPPMNVNFDNRGARMFFSVGRLEDGVTLEQASAEMQTIAQRLEEEYPQANDGQGINLLPLQQATMNPSQRAIFTRAGVLLAVVVGLLLLIACANVSSLLLARARNRRREIAVRLALGIDRKRLIRQLLTESFLLAALGAALAFPIAHWSLQLLWKSRGWLRTFHGAPMFAEGAVNLQLNPRVFLATLAVAVVSALLFGLVPALQASKSSIVQDLQGQPEPASRGRMRRLGARELIVVGQIALSLVALVGAALFLRSLQRAQEIDPGFEIENLALVSFNPGTQGYEPSRAREYYRRALERAESLPGVEGATLAEVRPLSVTFFRFLYRDGAPESQAAPVLTNIVGENFFETLGIPIVSGRAFSAEEDREDTRRVAVINQTMARQLWSEEGAVGRQFRVRGEQKPIEVVGVAEDAKYVLLGEEPRPYAYFPLEQRYAAGMTLHARTEGRAEDILPTLRRELQELDTNLPLVHAEPAPDLLRAALWAPQLGAILLSAYGFLALTLAAIGVFGLMRYSVQRRRQEIGIRLALGADRPQVLRMILKHGVLVAAVGGLVGLAFAAYLARLIRSLLFGVSSLDLPSFGVSVVILVVVALAASYFPARRATRVEPTTTLQAE